MRETDGYFATGRFLGKLVRTTKKDRFTGSAWIALHEAKSSCGKAAFDMDGVALNAITPFFSGILRF